MLTNVEGFAICLNDMYNKIRESENVAINIG